MPTIEALSTRGNISLTLDKICKIMHIAGNDDSVLHAFQKKSARGIKTPKHHIEMIERRLKQAKELHTERERQRKEGKG